MSRVACAYCGLPFKAGRVEPGKPVYCCTGCAVASRVPVDAKGAFPVNAALVSALVVGFVFFNQLLFWGLATLLATEGRAEAAAKCLLVSWTAAGATWLALSAGFARNRPLRVADVAVACATFALGVFGWTWSSPACAAAANGLLLLWSVRGLLRKKTVRKPDVTV
jgi:hypothetical protein